MPQKNQSSKPVAALAAFDCAQARVTLSGEWSLKNGFPAPDALLHEIASARPALATAAEPAPAEVVTIAFDCAALGRYDSSLPAYLHALNEGARRGGTRLAFAPGTLPDTIERMLSLATARQGAGTPEAAAGEALPGSSAVPGVRAATARHLAEGLFCRIGTAAARMVRPWGDALAFVGETMTALANLARGRARCRFPEFWFFVQACGVDAFPIIGLVSFLTGLILAYVGALQMRQVGAMIYVPGGVAISMMREMGVLMVAMVLCGRTATAYAAQLGSMKVSEEMAAYRSMGVPPVEYLVLPRILALVVTIPFLTLYANFFGIIGGLFVTTPMGVSLGQSYNMMALTMTLPNFTSGLIKSVAFAMLIGWIGCHRGMACGKSSEAVGDAATSAAVLGITLVIVADAIFAVLFNIIDFF
ncbi:MAG: ABC transporter permease [Puniceicoccales bacterium]|nr:ABC transporter permease [Puniceicoccales bacterium]